MRKVFKEYGIYQSTLLLNYTNILHGFAPFSLSTGPVDFSNSQAPELLDFYKELGISKDSLCFVNQVHGDQILSLSTSSVKQGVSLYLQENYDAIITNRRKILMGIKTADCIPIILFDPKTDAGAVVHGGWRSCEKHIIAKVIQKMRQEFGSASRDIIAVLGPGICQRCYEVGEDVATAFPRSVLTPRNDKFLLDLHKSHQKQLIQSGVPDSNIEDLKLCTFHQEKEFFSYRRDQTKKRHLNFLYLI
ncbi:MAG: peptidoglycan editing factor PgeF [Deltaproteobacteria bacterium]|nr:peptidoglycan editing factor PgeF [Deltaproteobacteria bacterium]